MTSIFLEPLDVLYLRGNKLFADAGAHGEALMPPWPSLAAGAIRSRLMAEGASLEALADFRLTQFGLARHHEGEVIEHLWPLPADVIVSNETKLSDATYLRPTNAPTGIGSISATRAVRFISCCSCTRACSFRCALTVLGLLSSTTGELMSCTTACSKSAVRAASGAAAR